VDHLVTEIVDTAKPSGTEAVGTLPGERPREYFRVNCSFTMTKIDGLLELSEHDRLVDIGDLRADIIDVLRR
jgi:ribosomal protein S10